MQKCVLLVFFFVLLEFILLLISMLFTVFIWFNMFVRIADDVIILCCCFLLSSTDVQFFILQTRRIKLRLFVYVEWHTISRFILVVPFISSFVAQMSRNKITHRSQYFPWKQTKLCLNKTNIICVLISFEWNHKYTHTHTLTRPQCVCKFVIDK